MRSPEQTKETNKTSIAEQEQKNIELLISHTENVHAPDSIGIFFTNLRRLMSSYFNQYSLKEEITLETLLSGCIYTENSTTDYGPESNFYLDVCREATKHWNANTHDLYGLYLFLQETVTKLQVVQDTEPAKKQLLLEQIFPNFVKYIKKLCLSVLDDFLQKQGVEESECTKLKKYLLRDNNSLDCIQFTAKNQTSHYEMVRPEMVMSLVIFAIADQEAFQHDPSLSHEQEYKLRAESLLRVMRIFTDWRSQEDNGSSTCNVGLRNGLFEVLYGKHKNIIRVVPDPGLIVKEFVQQILSEAFAQKNEEEQLKILFSDLELTDDTSGEEFIKNILGNEGEEMREKVINKLKQALSGEYYSTAQGLFTSPLDSYTNPETIRENIDYIIEDPMFILQERICAIESLLNKDSELPVWEIVQESYEKFKQNIQNNKICIPYKS